MPTFEHHIQKTQKGKDTGNQANAFFDWLKAQGIEMEGYSWTVHLIDPVTAQTAIWECISYGHYQVEGGWVVFLTYQYKKRRHVRQHNYRWVNGKADVSSHTLLEFIN